MNGWCEAARAVVQQVAASGQAFTGNDLWAAGLPATSNRRNLSGVLLGLEREGALERTGRRVPSVGGHFQPILEWKATA